MTIKAFITDLDGTLLTNTNTVVSGYETALTELQQLGLKIVIVSNLPHRKIDSRLDVLHINPYLVLTKEDVGIPKGSPLWIDRICTRSVVGYAVLPLSSVSTVSQSPAASPVSLATMISSPPADSAKVDVVAA